MQTHATDAPLLGEGMPPAQIFFSFQGRVSRRIFWLYGVLAPLGLALLGNGLLMIAGLSHDTSEKAMNLLLAWPVIAVSAKRWHDRDRSAWWVLIALIPLIGWIWALVDNGFLRGTLGPNRFGPSTD